MSNTTFATNKTFKTIGTTSDTMEPYVSTMGFRLELCTNAVGEGKHYAVRMMVVDTAYTDTVPDRAEEKTAKADARRAARERCDQMNDYIAA